MQSRALAEAKNFNICPHCVAKGRLGYLPRLTEDTSTRSDGRPLFVGVDFKYALNFGEPQEQRFRSLERSSFSCTSGVPWRVLQVLRGRGINNLRVFNGGVLKELVGDQPMRIVYLESSWEARRQRGSFTRDDLDKLDSHPVEAETQAVKKVANFVLDTSLLTPADSLARIRALGLSSAIKGGSSEPDIL